MSNFITWADWLAQIEDSDRDDLKRLVKEMKANKLAAKRELRDAYHADLAAVTDDDAADHGEDPEPVSEPEDSEEA